MPYPEPRAGRERKGGRRFRAGETVIQFTPGFIGSWSVLLLVAGNGVADGPQLYAKAVG
jgi:hypothetical protein